MIINNTENDVLNIDNRTYAGHLESLAPVADSDRYQFEQLDICNAPVGKDVFSYFPENPII